MLGINSHRVAVFVSGPHRASIQSLLVLGLALGGSTGAALRGSSDSDYGRIPLTFIANRGQSDSSVRFTAKGPGLTAYFTPREVVVDLGGQSIGMRYLGANASPRVDGLDLQQGHANFLIGNDASRWRTNVPLYGGVVYRALYPGVDMIYSSNKRLLKSEFVVAPGSDPSRIRIEYRGVDGLRVDQEGRLVIEVGGGELREETPEIYQGSGLGRKVVHGAFHVEGRVVSFEVGEYDQTRPLRIDPVLTYSTYLGGAGTERATAIAVDSTGAAYVTGYTDSSDFPVTGGVLQSLSGGGVEAFVTKLNTAGSAIAYSTYLGGNGDDRGFSIAVNAGGNAFVTGYTSSTNFPTAAAFQSSNGGGRDAFVVKLNATGTGLVYGTYLGGSGNDSGNGIAIDASGAAYITGSTASSNYPVLGAFQGSLSGGQDGFVTKLNNAGSALVYSTYLGGSLDDRGSSIAVDSSGAAYIAGNTNSTNFPILAAAQATNGGAPDAFVAKLNSAGSALAYSTYLGGAAAENVEVGHSIAVDSSNSAYVTGTTSSSNFPVAAAVQGVSKGGGSDAFVVKLTASGATFAYSTYLGGSSIDYGNSIAVDSGGSAYIGGYTASPDFPAGSASQPVIGGNYDAFVTKLDPAGSAVTESGFLGGNGADAGYGIAIDAGGNAYLTGQTFSTDFPLVGPIQNTLGSTLAAFAARFSFGLLSPATPVSVTPSGSGLSQTFTLVYSDSRGFADINWVEMNWSATQATADACYLHYNRSTNLLQLANDADNGWAGVLTPGVPGTMQNAQCTVDAGASSVSGAGNNLTVNLALTFKPAFAGTKSIYMRVQDGAGTLTAWTVLGTWTVPFGLPSAVSVTPSSGSGDTQIFSFLYTDPNGYADIKSVVILFQSILNGQNGCYVTYTVASNIAQLINDAGTAVVSGSVTLGTAGTLANSQCTLSSAPSSVTVSGNNLTVNLSLTFASGFAGAKNIYMGVVNNAGVFVNWVTKGAWTVAGSAGGTGLPSAVSVTPSSGTGVTQIFSLLYTDANGYADIKSVVVLFQSTLNGAGGCYVNYARATNTAQLISDAGTGVVPGTVTLGTAGTLSNTQCTLNSAPSSATVSGNDLTVNVSLTFSGTFVGTKNIYMGVVNNAGAFVDWVNKGTWTPQAGALPSSVSVTPSSGSGAAQIFSFLYTDANGFADIKSAVMLFQSTLNGQGGCYVTYTRAANSAQLINDAGTAVVAGTVTLGTAGTLSNSQCTFSGAASSATASGNNLTVNLSLTFAGAFAGTKNIYMGVVNNAGTFVNWVNRGTWTVQTGSLPFSVSVTPSSGSGVTQSFTYLYTDPNGFADIDWVAVLFQSSVTAQNACFVEYTRSTNVAVLENDAGTGFVPGTVTLGTAGTLSNSQCTLNAATSSAAASGSNLTVTLSLTFSGAFTGGKNIYMAVVNNGGVFVDWLSKGAWTVP